MRQSCLEGFLEGTVVLIEGWSFWVRLGCLIGWVTAWVGRTEKPSEPSLVFVKYTSFNLTLTCYGDIVGRSKVISKLINFPRQAGRTASGFVSNSVDIVWSWTCSRCSDYFPLSAINRWNNISWIFISCTAISRIVFHPITTLWLVSSIEIVSNCVPASYGQCPTG